METTLPYKYTPRPYQLSILKAIDNGIKRLVWVVHRRGGKDKTAWNITIKKAFERKGTYFYFLPTYSQAEKVIWKGIDKEGVAFLDHIPKETIKNLNHSSMRVELVNGSIIQLVGADKIDSIVGTNPIGCVFSEYSLMKENVWSFIRPILAENGGWAIFIFTPRGTNLGWNILQQAKENPDWFSEVLDVDTTKAIDPETIESEKRGMPQDLFEQEYYCKFIEGAGAFFKRIEHNTYDADDKVEPQHRYRLGVDWAKYQDFTVITAIDLMTFKVKKQDRFNQIDYNLQKAKLEAAYFRHFKSPVLMDSTGIGDPLYDDLCRRIDIAPYKFTEQTRKDLLVNLQILLEKDIIKIPKDPILIDELKSFKYTLTETGRIKIAVPEGMHDDCVFSLALACYNLPINPIPIHTLKRLNKEVDYTATSYE